MLHSLVETSRYAGSARNCQPWQYMAVSESQECDKIFPHLGWAGYLTNWKGPEQGERPTGYILCLLNHDWLKGSEKEAYFDLGIATQNMLLEAEQHQLAGCRIGNISSKLASLLTLPENSTLELVIALGYPAEKIVIEDMKENAVKYWRDEQLIHHVPKRKIDDLLIPCIWKNSA